jgi:hypothetical protein
MAAGREVRSRRVVCHANRPLRTLAQRPMAQAGGQGGGICSTGPWESCAMIPWIFSHS